MVETTARVIKRYANRKLYDTQDSSYVTLDQIAEMIREGENVKVVDNNTQSDLTSVTLAQIIFEEEKRQRSFLPLAALRNIIQSGGESLHGLMSQISESAERVGRVFRPDGDRKDREGGAQDEAAAGAEAAAPEPAASEAAAPEWADPTRIFREFMDGLHRAIDDWQRKVDANIHQAIESVSPLAPLQKEIQALGERITELERKLSQIEDA